MNWFDHSKLKGLHSFLSPSQHSWINYTPEKLKLVYINKKAIERGTQLHELAENLIKMHVSLPDTDDTLNLYVNDAIGFDMTPEVILYFSENCFGTTDAISFRNKVLRIHDLKTGETPASMVQLYIYAALFCLEYKQKPEDIKIILRIYQSNKFIEEVPLVSDIKHVMNVIESSDKAIKELVKED